MKNAGRILFVFLACAQFTTWGQTRYFISTIAGSTSVGDNGPATQAFLDNPTAVAVDAGGNIYIADTTNNRIRKVVPGGTITTIACNGAPGFSGNGGPATQAECNSPGGVAVDSAGNVYFSDTGNHDVRKIGLNGTISVFAGGGTFGVTGDGGLATAAALNQPEGLAVDTFGNLYIADREDQRVREVTANGIISTIAGVGYCSYSGDNGPASQAGLCYPEAIAIDSLGRVLIADSNSGRIRRFIPGGVITTIAGGGNNFNGDGGPATSASLAVPDGVAVDGSGVIYIAETNAQRIRAVATSGTISTIAGTLVGGFSGDSTAAIDASLYNPQGLAVDSRGDLYIADSGNDRIRVISALQVINTIAGSGHYAGDNGPAVSAILTDPSFVTMDSSGNLYVSDQGNHVVRKIDATGKITTIAGTGISGNTGDGGPATAAELQSPQGLAVDGTGNVYVADGGNGNVRKISPGGAIARIAGGGLSLGDGGPALNAMLLEPRGIALDAQGNIYVADIGANRVRRISTEGVIDTLIGNGTSSDTGDGGLASAATVAQPWDVKVAGDGTVYITENGSDRIRAVSPAGIASTAESVFSYLTGLALTSSGNMILSGLDEIIAIGPSGVNTVIAGGNQSGLAGDGGPALQALLNGPDGLVTDAAGNIYFCDQKNNLVRKLTPDTVSQVVSVSGNQQSGPVGTALPLPLVVQVNGSGGVPYPGVPVTYAITSGGGRLGVTQPVTGSNGEAAATLTLPAAGGTVTVTATVTGLPPVVFTATAVDMPNSISVLSGNNQIGLGGSTLPLILAVTVLGIDQQPIAGVPVEFAVTSGSATLNPASMQTGADGSAWTVATLGASGGPVTVSATAAGLPPATFSLTATAVNGPKISAGGVVSAGLSTPPLQTTAPNAIVSIFGQNFAPAGTSVSVTAATLVNGMLPTNLAGVCVLFGTERAPIFLVTPGQLNVQTPQVPAPGTPSVQVLTNCDAPDQEASDTVSVAIQPASPEFFYAALNANGQNPVAAADGVTGAGIGDPGRLGPGFALAYPGETVTIYATGLGLTALAFAAGQLPPSGAQVSNVTVSIDGEALEAPALQYAGVTPLNAGLYQLNIILPATLTSGDHSIGMTVAGRSSPPGAYISIGDTL